MKIKIVRIAIMAITAVTLHGAEDTMSKLEGKQSINTPLAAPLGVNAITLQSNDGYNVILDNNIWQQSGTLQDLYFWPDDSRVLPMDLFSKSQLEIARELMVLAKKSSYQAFLEPGKQNPTSPTKQQIQSTAKLIKKRMAKGMYPNTDYAELYHISAYFNIPIIIDALEAIITQLPLDSLQKLNESEHLTAPLEPLIKERIAAHHYLKTGQKTANFKGVSIQDLINNNKLPSIVSNRLNLASHSINSLDGLENIPNVDNLLTLNLRGNQITTIDNVQWPQNLQVLYLDRSRISNNQISTIDNAQWPHNLQELYLGSNQINTINNVQWPQSLQILGLDSNQISSIDNAQWPQNLQQLYLDRNPIPPAQIQQLRNYRPQLYVRF